MKFLPEDYEAPKSAGQYMKLEEGENRLRILSTPILGWEGWEEDKPHRFPFDQKPTNTTLTNIKHFWAFIVWNYQQERIQILHITQATIRNNIEMLYKDSDWGEPFFYDIKIIRKGKGKETEYMVNPLPHKEVTAKIKEEYMNTPCNLEAIFSNGQPFASEWASSPTPGVFEKTKQEISGLITKEQSFELEDIISGCSAKYKKQLFEFLNKEGVQRVQDLPTKLFDRVKNAALKKKKEYEDEQSLEVAI
jgi:hypothetical protein